MTIITYLVIGAFTVGGIYMDFRNTKKTVGVHTVKITGIQEKSSEIHSKLSNIDGKLNVLLRLNGVPLGE